MAHLWDRPDGDPDWLMHERLRVIVKERELENCQTDDVVSEVFDALVRVYYDVFNNGGCNLVDVTWLAVCMMSLEEYAKSINVPCPTFVSCIDDDPDGDYEFVTCDDMDAFARTILRYLYIHETTHE